MRKIMAAALAAAMLGAPAAASAEDVVLTVGEPLARASMLEPGVQRYLRYTVKDGHRRVIDIWSRTISFEEKDGKRLVRISQDWDFVPQPGQQPAHMTQVSLLEAGSMRPLTHIRTVTREGETQVGAYRFDEESVTGMPDYPGNIRKDFSIAGEEPLYNFVVDIEFFRQLALAEGRAFIASLYDPGSGKPDRYTFKVAGSDTIPGPDGRPIDCWVLTSDYNQPDKPVSRYWIAKSNQFLIRQESILDDGRRLVKTLLSSESGDAGTI